LHGIEDRDFGRDGLHGIEDRDFGRDGLHINRSGARRLSQLYSRVGFGGGRQKLNG
jgi:hypothetical protein